MDALYFFHYRKSNILPSTLEEWIYFQNIVILGKILIQNSRFIKTMKNNNFWNRKLIDITGSIN